MFKRLKNHIIYVFGSKKIKWLNCDIQNIGSLPYILDYFLYHALFNIKISSIFFSQIISLMKSLHLLVKKHKYQYYYPGLVNISSML